MTGFVQAIDDQGLQDTLSYDLTRAIAAAAPATYEHFLAEAKGDRVAGLTAYVHGGIGVALTQGELRGLLQIMEPASEALASALGEPIDDRSAAENVLLAMPYLPPSGRPTSVEEVHELAEQYTDAIVGGQVEQWLLALVADYGRRWEVILEIDAPLREPFTVQLCEERPVVIRGRSLLRHEVALDDARSYHLQVRVIDPSVRIAPGPVLRDSEGAIVGIPNLEGGRDTAELFAVYSSEPDRPTQAMAELTLQPVESVRFTATVVEVLAWFAAAAALLVSGEEALLLAKLGILTIPTTFAVSTSSCPRAESGRCSPHAVAEAENPRSVPHPVGGDLGPTRLVTARTLAAGRSDGQGKEGAAERCRQGPLISEEPEDGPLGQA